MRQRRLAAVTAALPAGSYAAMAAPAAGRMAKDKGVDTSMSSISSRRSQFEWRNGVAAEDHAQAQLKSMQQ